MTDARNPKATGEPTHYSEATPTNDALLLLGKAVIDLRNNCKDEFLVRQVTRWIEGGMKIIREIAAGAPAETPKPEIISTVYDCNCGVVFREPGGCRKCGAVFDRIAAQAAPVQPATGADGQDAKDAERYRWLLANYAIGDGYKHIDDALNYGEPEKLTAAIDAEIDTAMLAPANSEKPL
jgi:hypothetical protein